jgi:hypothetical protein
MSRSLFVGFGHAASEILGMCMVLFFVLILAVKLGSLHI